MRCFLIVTADEFELTVAVLDRMCDVIRWTGLARSYLYRAIENGSAIQVHDGKRYFVRKILLEDN